MKREAIFAAIDAERERQREKWSAGPHLWGRGDCSSTEVEPIVKVAVLAEECGEVARAILNIALIVALGAGATATDRERGWRQDECRFARADGAVGFSDAEVIATIRCAEARWPVEGGFARAVDVARCESGLDEYASNGGRYLGVYQHSATYWPGRVRAYDPAAWDRGLGGSAFNARSNVVVSIRMAHSGGWGAWSCA